MIIAAIETFDGGMKAWLALGGAVRSAAGVEVSWVFQGTNCAVGGSGALGWVVSKFQASGALGVRSKGKVALHLEPSTKKGEASVEGFICCFFAGNCEDHS